MKSLLLFVPAFAILLAGCGENPVAPPPAADLQDLQSRLKKLEEQFSLVMEENKSMKKQLESLHRDIASGRAAGAARREIPAASVQAAPSAQAGAPETPAQRGPSISTRIAPALPAQSAPAAASQAPGQPSAAGDERQAYSMIRSMLHRRPVDEIARVLNERNLRTREGKAWDRAAVAEAIRRFSLDRPANPQPGGNPAVKP